MSKDCVFLEEKPQGPQVLRRRRLQETRERGGGGPQEQEEEEERGESLDRGLQEGGDSETQTLRGQQGKRGKSLRRERRERGKERGEKERGERREDTGQKRSEEAKRLHHTVTLTDCGFQVSHSLVRGSYMS